MKYVLVLLGIVFAVAAQILLKTASSASSLSTKWLIYMALSAALYVVAFVFQSYVYRYFSLSKIAPAMATAIMLLVVLCGVWIFNETIQTKQIIGILFGIISIYLIIG